MCMGNKIGPHWQPLTITLFLEFLLHFPLVLIFLLIRQKDMIEYVCVDKTSYDEL